MDRTIYRALNQEEHQTKIAGTHMALAALEHGVGSCWVSRFEVSTLATLLKLPNNILPSEILVFGYPDHPQNQIKKKTLEELVYYNDSGDPSESC
jgi:nitroreductase